MSSVQPEPDAKAWIEARRWNEASEVDPSEDGHYDILYVAPPDSKGQEIAGESIGYWEGRTRKWFHGFLVKGEVKMWRPRTFP